MWIPSRTCFAAQRFREAAEQPIYTPIKQFSLLCEWKVSVLTKSQYKWPTRMTMNADRKLISQPSVDSENNERVTSERVGSSRF